MHAAEHRSTRELYAMAQQLVRRWTKLGPQLGVGELEAGVALAREHMAALRERPLDVPVGAAARNAGTGVGALARVLDRSLERHQALRLAVLDVVPREVLCGWLSALARERGDTELAAFHDGWYARYAELDATVRAAVVALAADPEGAIAPADPGPLGRAGHKAALALGTLGEKIDGR